MYKFSLTDWAAHPKVREARKLLFEAERELLNAYKERIGTDQCECGHARADHFPTISVNCTDGLCRICRLCKGFILRREKDK